MKRRALELKMSYACERPMSMVVVEPLTLPNQGVEELRDEDLSRAWIREREDRELSSVVYQSVNMWQGVIVLRTSFI